VPGRLGAQAQPVTVRRQHLPVADRNPPVCTDGSSGHDDSSQTDCHDEPVERAADRNPKPNYIDVTYPDGQGGTTVQRVWFALKD
jgi:hypothetical protein